jgi:hypothetical protein
MVDSQLVSKIVTEWESHCQKGQRVDFLSYYFLVIHIARIQIDLCTGSILIGQVAPTLTARQVIATTFQPYFLEAPLVLIKFPPIVAFSFSIDIQKQLPPPAHARKHS